MFWALCTRALYYSVALAPGCLPEPCATCRLGISSSCKEVSSGKPSAQYPCCFLGKTCARFSLFSLVLWTPPDWRRRRRTAPGRASRARERTTLVECCEKKRKKMPSYFLQLKAKVEEEEEKVQTERERQSISLRSRERCIGSATVKPTTEPGKTFKNTHKKSFRFPPLSGWERKRLWEAPWSRQSGSSERKERKKEGRKSACTLWRIAVAALWYYAEPSPKRVFLLSFLFFPARYRLCSSDRRGPLSLYQALLIEILSSYNTFVGLSYLLIGLGCRFDRPNLQWIKDCFLRQLRRFLVLIDVLLESSSSTSLLDIVTLVSRRSLPLYVFPC